MKINNTGRRRTEYRWWTPEEDALLTRLYADHKLADIANLLGRGISSVANRRQKLGLRRTPEQQARIGNGRFRPGHKTWNKGKSHRPEGSRATQFKLGDKPSNTWRPIGAERMTKDGVVIRKVSDTGNKWKDWRPVQVIEWEAHNGPLPDGHIVVFKDRDRTNLAPDNLEAITRAENMRRNSISRYGEDYRSAAIQLGWFKRKINRIEKEQQNENPE